MNLSDIDEQIRLLQQQQTELRLSRGPVGWRRKGLDGQWVLVQVGSFCDAQLREFGCEPVYAERKPMDDALATKIARQHKGAALVRAVEQWHGIAA